MNFSISQDSPTQLSADLLVVLATQEQLEAPAGSPLGAVAEVAGPSLLDVAKEEGFKAKAGQTLLARNIQGIAAPRVLLVGLGATADVTPADLHEAAARSTRKALKLRAANVAITLAHDDARNLSGACTGAAHGAYTYNNYRTPGEDDFGGVQTITIFSAQDAEAQLDATTKVNQGVKLARDLVNEPPLDLVPEKMAQVGREIAERHNLSVTIIEEAELQERGFNLIMAVGKGSDNPPRLVHLTYSPAGEVKHKIAFVGKGVTFDTGGYNIKTGGHMFNMHCDMGGGAAVLGAAEAIGALAPEGVEVHFIVPAAENSVSGNAMRPNDIYRGYGNQTVEIGNTDAEGRLILADALAYAQEQGVDTIIDLATLTGACVVALGDYTSGLFTDDQGLADELQAAIATTGEDFWRMPLHKKLDRQLDSSYADMKNIGQRAGGAITAALFLKRWVKIDRWAHMDIAAPAFAESETEAQAHGGTGFGVSTLAELAVSLGK